MFPVSSEDDEIEPEFEENPSTMIQDRKLLWTCPHCGAHLQTKQSVAHRQHRCPGCQCLSCPNDVIASDTLAVVDALAHVDQRAIRQSLRDFRAGLRDAYEGELKAMLGVLSNYELTMAGSYQSRLAELFCDALEEELELRVRETTWEKMKRLARRGAKSTQEWLKTDEGKAVAEGVAIVGAFLGIKLLG